MKSLSELRGNRNVSAAPTRLGLLLVGLTAVTPYHVAHVQDARLEVHILPSQPADLLLPHAGTECDSDREIHWSLARDFEIGEELCALFGIERIGLPLY